MEIKPKTGPYSRMSYKAVPTEDSPEEYFDLQEENVVRNSRDEMLLAARIARRQSVKLWMYLILMTVAIFFFLMYVFFASETPSVEHPIVLAKDDRERMDLKEVVNSVYVPDFFNGKWISDYELIYEEGDLSWSLYDVKRKRGRQLISLKFLVSVCLLLPKTYEGNHLQDKERARFHGLSQDKTFAFIAENIKRVFRYTSTASYKIYNLKTGNLVPLTAGLSNGTSAGERMQYVSWGPIGSQHVMIVNNNIFYKPGAHSVPEQVTLENPGVDLISNGIPDWVYEEEILKEDHAIWFSPNGSKLCFTTFDDRQVGQMFITQYGEYSSRYPDYKSVRYPKPGTAIPTVNLWVVDLKQPYKRSERVLPPVEVQKLEQYYLTRVKWIDEESILAFWLSRDQTYGVVGVCKKRHETPQGWWSISITSNWICVKSVEKSSVSRGGWLESLYDEPLISPDGRQYALILPSLQREPGRGYYRHIAMVDITTGNQTFITRGLFDVTEICAFRLFSSPRPGLPGERHIWVVDLSLNGKQFDKPKCLTCTPFNERCLYSKSQFSRKATFYVLECRGPGVPYTDLIDTQTGEKNASVKLYLPPGLDEGSTRRDHPLVIEVYGGPRIQMVDEQFPYTSHGWGLYLASNRNVVYGLIDGRGSANRGDTFAFATYRNLGTVEVEDQIVVTRYLRDSLKYIDGDNIAISGTSYGGYVSAMALSYNEGQDQVFKCAVSISPVTSWLYYDNVYTERYLGEPLGNNLNLYIDSSLISRAKFLQGKPFLLIHGTGDDNVHFQNSIQLMKALIEAQVLFSTQIYPDDNHNIHSRLHLFRSVERFLFRECFAPRDTHS